MTPETAILEAVCATLMADMSLRRPSGVEIMLGPQAHPRADRVFLAVQSPGYRGQQTFQAATNRVFGAAVTVFLKTASVVTPWQLQYKAYDEMNPLMEQVIESLAFNNDLVHRARDLLSQDGSYSTFHGHLELHGVNQIAPAPATMWGAAPSPETTWAGIYRTATFWGIEG